MKWIFYLFFTSTIIFSTDLLAQTKDPFFEKNYTTSMFDESRPQRPTPKSGGESSQIFPAESADHSKSAGFTQVAPGKEGVHQLEIKCAIPEITFFDIKSIDILYDFQSTKIQDVLPKNQALRVGKIYSVADDSAPEDRQKVSDDKMKVFNSNIRFFRNERPPEAKRVQFSPAYIVHTKYGKIILEGISNIDKYVNPDGTLPCIKQDLAQASSSVQASSMVPQVQNKLRSP